MTKKKLSTRLFRQSPIVFLVLMLGVAASEFTNISADPKTAPAIPASSVGHVAALEFEAYVRKPTRVEQKNLAGRCPRSIRFQAVIIANGAGTARYRWVWSDGGTSRDEAVTLSRAGAKVVNATWTIGTSLNGWGAIKLLSPTESEPVRIMEFNLTCR